jgi:hypothetical protein
MFEKDRLNILSMLETTEIHLQKEEEFFQKVSA